MLAQPVDDIGMLVGPVVVEGQVQLLLRVSPGEQLEEGRRCSRTKAWS
jgi:hypothetical protein